MARSRSRNNSTNTANIYVNGTVLIANYSGNVGGLFTGRKLKFGQ